MKKGKKQDGVTIIAFTYCFTLHHKIVILSCSRVF